MTTIALVRLLHAIAEQVVDANDQASASYELEVLRAALAGLEDARTALLDRERCALAQAGEAP